MKSVGTTTADALLAVIEGEFRELEAAEFTAYRYACTRLETARVHHIDLYGRKDGAARFREWRAESLGLGQSAASKMLTIAAHLPVNVPDTLCQSYLYAVARAVKLGKGAAGELLAQAASMPMLDFTESLALVKPRAPKDEPTCTCPECGHTAPRSTFEEES